MNWLRRMLSPPSTDHGAVPLAHDSAATHSVDPAAILDIIERAYLAKDQGLPHQAAAILASGLTLAPRSCAVLNALGLVYRDLHESARALEYFTLSLAIDPDHLSSLCNLAALLIELDRASEASEHCRRALLLRPGFEPALSTLALADNALGRHHEALAIFDALIERDGQRIALRRNRALTLQELGRFEDALTDFKKIVELDPSDANARYSLASNLLLCGEFKSGWAMHEIRLALPGALHASLDALRMKPAWDGKRDLKGKTILLYGEQGFGDTIQFSRYCRLVKARGARVLLGVPAPLRRLFSDLEGVDELLGDDQALPAFDEHISLMSLPFAFETDLPSIPDPGRPLSASSAAARRWSERLPPPQTVRVGVVWRGNPNQADNQRRSIDLESFAGLFELPIEFLSLQRDVSVTEEGLLARFSNVIPCGPQLDDFDDSAAVIAQCDLLISVCSAPAHLAGAMAKPCWVLLSDRADWRWLLNRSDTPWYPALRLFRRQSASNWKQLIATVKIELAKML